MIQEDESEAKTGKRCKRLVPDELEGEAAEHAFRTGLLLGLVDSELCNEHEREQDRGRSSRSLG